MAVRATLVRFVGFALLAYLVLVVAAVILRPELWWLAAPFFASLWIWGFSLSHAYVFTHDGISSSER
jgi:hypothetical protein